METMTLAAYKAAHNIEKLFVLFFPSKCYKDSEVPYHFAATSGLKAGQELPEAELWLSKQAAEAYQRGETYRLMVTTMEDGKQLITASNVCQGEKTL